MSEVASALRDGSETSVGLVERLIARADRVDTEIGAYQERFDESALAAAEVADRELAMELDRGPLHGIPVAIKDNIAVADGPTTAGSLVHDPAWGEGRDAPVVTRLREAGAVITGKTTTTEFAYAPQEVSKPFPAPRSPWDLTRWAGGSSSGSGGAVAAGLALATLGTDTGGSIRVPAAYCGVSGLVPTYGRVPKSGCVPLAYTLDHLGPLATSARDCASVLTAIAGPHPSDHTSVDRPVPDYAANLGEPIQGLRVGVVRAHFFPAQADPELDAVFETATAALELAGATLVDISLPLFSEMLAASFVTIASEALAYQRNDLAARWSEFSVDVRLGFAEGAFVSGADYAQAQRARRLAQRQVARLFDEVDVIVSPTVLTGAIPFDALHSQPPPQPDDVSQDSETPLEVFPPRYWNCLGNPVLAVPMGFTRAGLPLSMQIAGRPFEEDLVLRVGDSYQSLTEWHRILPPVLDLA